MNTGYKLLLGMAGFAIGVATYNVCAGKNDDRLQVISPAPRPVSPTHIMFIEPLANKLGEIEAEVARCKEARGAYIPRKSIAGLLGEFIGAKRELAECLGLEVRKLHGWGQNVSLLERNERVAFLESKLPLIEGMDAHTGIQAMLQQTKEGWRFRERARSVSSPQQVREGLRFRQRAHSMSTSRACAVETVAERRDSLGSTLSSVSVESN